MAVKPQEGLLRYQKLIEDPPACPLAKMDQGVFCFSYKGQTIKKCLGWNCFLHWASRPARR